MTKCRSKVKEPWSSSITSANTMPTSVINSRAVLIVRLICHDEKVYEENIFCKASQYKSQLHFPSQNNRTCTKLTCKQQSTFLPNSRVVLIVRLLCPDENVYEEIMFAKQVSIKVNCIFLHKITGLAQDLPISNNQP